MKRMVALMTLGLALVATMASAQDMMRDVDLTSPAMVSAEMSRQEVEAILAKASPGAPADFTGKRLSGLDLSGLEAGEARELRAQRAGAGAELLERQEFPMIGNAREVRSEVYRRASDE